MGPAHRFVAPAAGDEPSRVGAPAGMFRYDCVALGTRVTCALIRLLYSIRKSCRQIGVLLRVKGNSMQPMMHDGDILAVDSSQTDRSQLNGKVVVVANEQKGLCISRLRRYENVDVLEPENRDYKPIVFTKRHLLHTLLKV